MSDAEALVRRLAETGLLEKHETRLLVGHVQAMLNTNDEAIALEEWRMAKAVQAVAESWACEHELIASARWKPGRLALVTALANEVPE